MNIHAEIANLFHKFSTSEWNMVDGFVNYDYVEADIQIALGSRIEEISREEFFDLFNSLVDLHLLQLEAA